MAEWSWRFSPTARDDFGGLEPDERDRIVAKLEEICSSPWRDPPDYGEPMRNSPDRKVRIGQFRLSVSFSRDEQRMTVNRIKHRSGAYTADD